MTKNKLRPKILGKFINYADWVNRGSKELSHFKHEYGHKIDAVCMDAVGRRCTCGGDFARAEKEGTFPVYYFIECEVKLSPVQALESLTNDIIHDDNGAVEIVRTALEQNSTLLHEMEKLAKALEDTGHEPEQSFYDAIKQARGE